MNELTEEEQRELHAAFVAAQAAIKRAQRMTEKLCHILQRFDKNATLQIVDPILGELQGAVHALPYARDYAEHALD